MGRFIETWPWESSLLQGNFLFLPAVMAEKQSKGKQCFAGARKAFCA
jgi:hypothetical protein